MKKVSNKSKKKIDFNQKSFSFTHRYDQQKFKLDKLNNIKDKFQIKINNRLILSSIIFSTVFFAIAIQIIHLNFIFNPNEKYFSNNQIIKRPNIIDRNNVSLTANLKMQNIQVFPEKIYNQERFLNKITSIYDDISYKTIQEKINKNKFFYLKRNVSPQELQKIINLGETGIEIKDSYKRKYLHKSLFSHVIGEVDIDNNGISGLEMSIDKSKINEDLVSSLDLRVQHIVRDEIINAINVFEAKGGSGLVMNINNGEILSMVSLPDFDPNLSDGEKFNRNTLGLYEFGSVMKTFTVAIGLEEKKFNINTKYKIDRNIKVGKNKVSDVHSPCKQEYCSVEDIQGQMIVV